jgi:hypothetical protein
MPLRSITFVVLILFSVVVLAANDTTLCAPNEKVAFSCYAEKKTISVCIVNNAPPAKTQIEYRYGKIGQPVELTYPARVALATDAFSFAYEGYAKGSTRELAFHIGNFTYTLHDDRHAFRGWASGVIVEENGNRVSYAKCAKDPIEGLITLDEIWPRPKAPRYVGTPEP